MFNIDSSELLLVAFVALVVIGPKDLPKAMRVVGYWVGRARGVARQFRSGFDQMVREAELEEMEKRWAAENERIMREHPQADQPGDADAVAGDAPAATDDAPPPPGHHPERHDTTSDPVMVEQPHIVPAPYDAPHRSGGAAS